VTIIATGLQAGFNQDAPACSYRGGGFTVPPAPAHLRPAAAPRHHRRSFAAAAAWPPPHAPRKKRHLGRAPHSGYARYERVETDHMIKDRFYIPAENELIYHYCPPEAFLGIVQSRTIWASAYYTQNDSMERNWGYHIFERTIDRLRDRVDERFIAITTDIIRSTFNTAMIMLSCYSLDADVLSQWRGYANDGLGFAIGFSKALMKLPAKPLRVLYDEGIQLCELYGNLMHVHDYEKSIGFKYDDKFQRHIHGIGADLCAYKNPAFHEEKEIRLVHASGLLPEGSSSKIVPLGARNPEKPEERLSEPIDIRFRISKGLIVPYVALDYSTSGAVNPIRSVILGPPNPNAERNVEIFLNTLGLVDVTVRRSRAPYA
jgi:hypothetical protein